MQLKPETMKDLMKTGLLYRRKLDTKPGAATLRVVVRDAGSGLVGSIGVPLSKVVRIESLQPDPANGK
jgi:hypothetical protein